MRSANKLRAVLASMAIIGVAVFSLALLGCGGASKDQGISVLATGLFETAGDSSSDEFPPGVVGVIAPQAPSAEAFGAVARTSAFMGFQNNLNGQFVNLRRAYFEYFVPGSDLAPPSSSQAISGVMGPGSLPDGGGEEEGAVLGSSAPDAITTLASRAYAEVLFWPQQVRAWFNFNRDSLPEPPFNVTVRIHADAISSAGDLFVTNPIDVILIITPEVIVGGSEFLGGGGGTDGGDSGGDDPTPTT